MESLLVSRHLETSLQNQRLLAQILSPLFAGSLVKFFSYNRYFRNQTWIGLYSDTVPVQGDLLAGRGPLFVDKKGVFIEEGIYLHKDLEDILKTHVHPHAVADFFSQEDNPEGFLVVQNGLLIIRKGPIYDESFYFSLKETYVKDRCYFYTVVNDLKKYCLYFLSRAKTIIAAAEKKPTMYHLPTSCADKFDVIFFKAECDIAVDVKKFGFSTLYGDVFLSAQELKCLRLLAQGYTQKEIAESLALSIKTIEAYIRGLKNKLVAETKEELARYYHDFALLDYQKNSKK